MKIMINQKTLLKKKKIEIRKDKITEATIIKEIIIKEDTGITKTTTDKIMIKETIRTIKGIIKIEITTEVVIEMKEGIGMTTIKGEIIKTTIVIHFILLLDFVE